MTVSATVFRPSLRVCCMGALTVAVLGLVGCATPEPALHASAHMQPTRGNATGGRINFVQKGNTLTVSGTITGLKPGSEHGFHVHEKGDCSSGDGLSAGGHFNPVGAMHGQYGHGTHHVGDLPSLMADASGNARVHFESITLTLKPGATSVVGKGLIVHRDPDDYKTQPTGNAGPRLACGVIYG